MAVIWVIDEGLFTHVGNGEKFVHEKDGKVQKSSGHNHLESWRQLPVRVEEVEIGVECINFVYWVNVIKDVWERQRKNIMFGRRLGVENGLGWTSRAQRGWTRPWTEKEAPEPSSTSFIFRESSLILWPHRTLVHVNNNENELNEFVIIKGGQIKFLLLFCLNLWKKQVEPWSSSFAPFALLSVYLLPLWTCQY